MSTDPNPSRGAGTARTYGGMSDAAASGGTTAFAPNGPMSALLAQNWWAIALRGVAAILFGIIAVALPGLTIASLVLLFAAYMLVDGILAIVAAVRAARRHERWGMLVLEGIANLAAGAVAVLFPLATVLAVVLLMGAWGIVSGILMLTAAFRLNPAHGRGLMIFSGIVSVVWGFLLILWPLVGALVLAWWLGAYALIFGVSLLVLAFRLRQHRHDYLPSGTAPAHS